MKGTRKIALIVLSVILVVGALAGVFVSRIGAANHQKKARVVATTYAVVQIADKLKLPLVGVPTTQNKIPARYAHVARVGNPMNPNVEKIASLKPTVVYSVTTLQDQFGKAFKQRHIEPHFLNLTSVATLKKTITTMGKQYDRTSEAKNAVDEINHSETQVKNVAHKHAQKPRVLILMGLPGASYMIATNQSYVGNLVQIAGGENVFSSKTQEFISPNDEAIKKAQPQVILRLAHALPNIVIPQFNAAFKHDPMWKTLPAVKNHRVYDLTEPNFDATANMKASKALQIVSNWLYPQKEAGSK
ncbi:heme ABC transporter substrate-binding protein IsdE [Lactobacillus helveticus]|uniref:High-affinity heme uptake system protein IsdE n=2 Tax=Lentilactobacillus kefiri TaxID=33962 RepID=A0A8E1RGJ0_LENKE|nr:MULTISPECIES: heme ABC transporter substrate-binding protein IsdE [Lactobacillaceae]KRL69349.1 heme ABC transporter heme-binding protein isdE [Lentilactobacillus parakefiri DSM 10551]KRM49619.1 heme ABC transporter heme-binding protein isdE [Lentilactobacillus kefiri DSM 20587 = JCM 5818]MCJ2162831.1 heme ABC transporter substrate-binding protein IsdE [Lentilactobacillus kefiri]MCP9370233.1 heme ABC transporter substrate-binding protein IsdE [Lentilactobacillus kefiri]MDH5109602.1 heme ABC 